MTLKTLQAKARATLKKDWQDNLANQDPYIILDSIIASTIKEFGEIIEAVPVERAHTYSSENADIYRAHDKGQEDMKARIIRSLTETV